MNRPRGDIAPFYFGTSTKPLFGCYHPPQTGGQRECGVVLCAPMGEEYIRFHRALRHLAGRLAAVGFAVLRFDFYGCGDSAGAGTQGTLGQWRTDITTAMQEIRRRGGVQKVCLVGLRLGGALAMQVGVQRGDVDRMVLWDPVLSGRTYLAELYRLHRAMVRYAHVRPHTRGDTPVEILGFPLTEAIRCELEHLDLCTTHQKPAQHILLIESHHTMAQRPLKAHLTRLETSVDYQPLPDPRLWAWVEDVSKVLVPLKILQVVVSWLAAGYP